MKADGQPASRASVACLGAMRWLIPPVLVPVAYVVIAATPLGPNLLWMFAAPAFAVHWVAYVIATAKRLDAAAQAAAWPRVGALSAVLALLLFCLWSPLRIIRALNFVGDGVHLAVMEPDYIRQIAKLSPPGRDLVVFCLGGSNFNSILLVYDRSDQVMLAPGLRSADWVRKAEGTDLACEPHARALWGHWYRVFTDC